MEKNPGRIRRQVRRKANKIINRTGKIFVSLFIVLEQIEGFGFDVFFVDFLIILSSAGKRFWLLSEQQLGIRLVNLINLTN